MQQSQSNTSHEFQYAYANTDQTQNFPSHALVPYSYHPSEKTILSFDFFVLG